jgi:hypothetical protein
MFARTSLASFLTLALALCVFTDAGAQDKDKKKRTGTVTGEIKSSKTSPNGKNQIIEVLGAGEEKERAYRVAFDPKVGGPIADVLAKVKAAKVGDRVRLEWVEGEGYNITAFEVLKKSKDGDKKDK